MAESWLHEALCRQRPELWLRVGYIKAVCRQRPEMWPIVRYMKLCVERDLKCG